MMPAFAEPAITLSPPEGPAGTMLDIDGSGFVPNSIITVSFAGGNMQTRPQTISTDTLGNFSATIEVPHSIGGGSYDVVAVGHGVDRVSATSSFKVTVPNNPPVAVSQTYSIDQGRQLDIALKGNDPDGDTISFAIVDQPRHGNITNLDATTGSLKFIASSDYEGNDRLTFKVNDGQHDSFLAEVSIRIMGPNSGPRMEDMQVELQEDTRLDIMLRATDNDSPSLTFEIVDQPTHGSLDYIRPYDGSSARVLYTPHPNFNGTDAFTAKARDTRFESIPATVTINVTGVQDSPIASGAQIVANVGEQIKIILNATDPDGDVLLYSIESQPAHGTIVGTAPLLEYVPSDYRGWDSFTFKVNDGTVDSNVARIQVKVGQVATTDNSANIGAASGSDTESTATTEPLPEEPAEVPPTVTEPVIEDQSPPETDVPVVSEPVTNPLPAMDSSTPVEQEPIGADTEPPRIVFPASTLVFDSSSEAGTSVDYNIVAIDAVDGEINPECSPASGSRFPVGKVNVVCTAADSAGNSALGSFAVEVRLLPGEPEKASPAQFDISSLQIPELHFAVIPSIIAGLIGAGLVVGLKVAKKGRAKSSEPPKSSS